MHMLSELGAYRRAILRDIFASMEMLSVLFRLDPSVPFFHARTVIKEQHERLVCLCIGELHRQKINIL